MSARVLLLAGLMLGACADQKASEKASTHAPAPSPAVASEIITFEGIALGEAGVVDRVLALARRSAAIDSISRLSATSRLNRALRAAR